MGINQATSLVNLIAGLRKRMWEVCGLAYPKIHISIDTKKEFLLVTHHSYKTRLAVPSAVCLGGGHVFRHRADGSVHIA